MVAFSNEITVSRKMFFSKYPLVLKMPVGSFFIAFFVGDCNCWKQVSILNSSEENTLKINFFLMGGENLNLTANLCQSLPLWKAILADAQAQSKQVFRVLGKEAQKGSLLFDDLPPASSTDSGTVFRLSQVCVNVSSWDCSCLNFFPFPHFQHTDVLGVGLS